MAPVKAKTGGETEAAVVGTTAASQLLVHKLSRLCTSCPKKVETAAIVFKSALHKFLKFRSKLYQRNNKRFVDLGTDRKLTCTSADESEIAFESETHC